MPTNASSARVSIDRREEHLLGWRRKFFAEVIMRKLFLLTAGVVLVVAGSASAQDKKTLAIVVKGLDNPFFEQVNLGCQKWQSENPDSEYECLYTGPASSADEAGEIQIIDDLLTRGVAAIAISPSNAPLMRTARANRPEPRSTRW